MSGDRRSLTVYVRLALLERDFEEVRKKLDGDGRGQKGLAATVDELVDVADRGRWSLRIALWIGGGIVAVSTALAQFRSAITALFGGGSLPGH